MATGSFNCIPEITAINLVMAWGRAYGVWGCILGPVVITGLLLVPSYILNSLDDFGIKPMTYYGLDYKRAGTVTMCMALLASFFIIGHTVLMWLGPGITPLTAGYVLLICFMSILFNNMYLMDIKSTQRSIQTLYNETGEVPLEIGIIGYGGDSWLYRRQDWGRYFEPCQDLPENKLHSCIGNAFYSTSNEFIRKSRLLNLCQIGFSCCFILYLVNPRPLKTIGVFLGMVIFMSLWVLPIYMSALKTRSPSKIGLEKCTDGWYATLVLAFAWCTVAAMLAISIFGAFDRVTGAVVASLAFVLFNILVVVYMVKLLKDRGSRSCGPFHEREMEILPMVAIPQYIITGIVALAVLAMICMCLCSGGDTEKAESVMVIYRVTYIVRME